MALPPMDENLRQLLSAFNANHVRYVVIGGYAVFVHAQPRMTKDLDIFIESSPQNGWLLTKASLSSEPHFRSSPSKTFPTAEQSLALAYRRSVSR